MYFKGKPIGIARGYFDNGQLRAEMSYSDGELEGIYLLYNKKGELVDQKLYVYGVEYSVLYNELNDSYRYTPSSELN